MAAKHVKTWRAKTKARIVESMGGKCCTCGYDKCQAALELHHLNPKEKTFTFGGIRSTPISWSRIVDELRKCVLVCSNCHKEIEAGVTKLPDNFSGFNEQYVTYKIRRHSGTYVGERKICVGCKQEFQPYRKTQKYCTEMCGFEHKRNLVDRWPDIKILKKESIDWGYEATGRKYGFSGAAVKKRLKKFGLLK